MIDAEFQDPKYELCCRVPDKRDSEGEEEVKSFFQPGRQRV